LSKKKDMKKYKSPIIALMWSATMCGFGQFYNGQYYFGTLLLILELTFNFLANLNLSIYHSFHGDYQTAHEVVRYQWGLFYPSAYSFSIWQAYNKAITLNYQREGKTPPRESLTGFCIGLVVGMNLGVYWHHHFLTVCLSKHLSSPVFNGLLLGITIGFMGHGIEKYVKYRTKKKRNKPYS